MKPVQIVQLIIDSRSHSNEVHRVSKLSMSGLRARYDCYMADPYNIEIVIAKSQRHYHAPRSLYLPISRFTLLPSHSVESDSDWECSSKGLPTLKYLAFYTPQSKESRVLAIQNVGSSR